jgi:hypothetical protein
MQHVSERNEWRSKRCLDSIARQSAPANAGGATQVATLCSSAPSVSPAPDSAPPSAVRSAPPAIANGASPAFDRTKASTTIEHMICSSDDLSRLDSQLASAYVAKRNGSSDPTAVKKQQQDWVKVRNQCADANCLTAAYQNRLRELQ